MLLLPFLAVFLLLTALPIIASLGMSMTDISIRELRDPLSVNFVGLDNFIKVASNSAFQKAALTTGLFVILCVPATIAMGFVLALLLNGVIRRLRNQYRAAAYLPVIANIVAAAVIWQYAFAPSGLVNGGLESFGIDGPNWLGDPQWAITTVVMLGVWRNIGTAMILFLAGLQAIPADVYEAADIDGASTTRKVFSITLPLLRPTMLLITVLNTVAFLNIFEEPYLLTAGGPLSSTRSIALWVYEQFGFGNIAASMSASFMLLLLVGIVATVQFRVLRPKH